MADSQDRSIRRKLGKNQTLPHTHHPRDVPGVLSIVSAPGSLIPFDTLVEEGVTVNPSTSAVVFSVLDEMFVSAVLPPLTTPANKYRVHLRFNGSFLCGSESRLELQFFQGNPLVPPTVAIGTALQAGNAGAGGIAQIHAVSLTQTFEVAPGNYLWQVQWREVNGLPGNAVASVGVLRRFEVEADTLVVS